MTLPNAINVQAGSLLPGTYTGSVAISGSTSAADNITVAVTLNVTTSPVIDLTQISTSEIFAVPGGAKVTSYFSFATTGGSALNVTAAAGSASFLSASAYSANTIAITADPTGLAAGVYHGNVTITSNAANNAAVSVPVDFLVSTAGIANISQSGVVNPVTYVSEPFAPGAIVAVFGNLFASAGTAATNPSLPLATTLGSAQVLINGTPAPLFYVSPTQINVQLPYSLTVGTTATVQAVAGSVKGNLRPITIAANTPRILTLSSSYALAFNLTDGSLPLPSSISVPPYASHPAKPGDILEIFAVGFGQTSPPAVEGAAATSSPLEYAPTTTVGFGGGILSGQQVVVTPLFSGLTPTQSGLYQINVTIPATAPLGSFRFPVTVNVGGAVANFVNVAISANGK